MRYFIKAVILIFSLILQSTLFAFLDIFGVVPNILLTFVIAVCFFSDDVVEPVIFGLAAGVLYDIAWGRIFGVHSLLMMYTAICVFYAASYLYAKNFTSQAAVGFIASLLYMVLFYLVSFTMFGKGGFVYVLFRLIIPAAAYTAFIQIFMCLLVSKVNKKRGNSV